MHFLKKLWKMLEIQMNINIEIQINIKKKKLFGFRTKSSYYKVFQREIVSDRNKKNRDTYG